jgi:quercetin dioxygenase-like cupin family protein
VGEPVDETLVQLVSEHLVEAMTPARPEAPRTVRSRLLATLGTVDRFAPFIDDLVALFQLPADSIRALLARIDDAGRPWERTLLGKPLDGAELFHFAVGPALAASGGAGGVLRLRAGARFPMHRHHGDEVTFVLEGGYREAGDGAGPIHGPGSVIERSGDSAHDYQAAPGRDLVMMVLHRGISFV